MKPTYTVAGYRAKLLAATVMIRNLALEEYEGAPPMQYNMRGIHLDYALRHLHDVQKMLPRPDLLPLDMSAVEARAYRRAGGEPQITPAIMEAFRKNPDPDTSLFDFTPDERDHIRTGQYMDLKHSCEMCLTIDKIISGMEL